MGEIMKNFVVVTAVLAAALGLAACTPTDKEAEAPEEATSEAPAVTEEAPAAEGGMAEEGPTSETDSDDPAEGHGNPVDQ
jgi:hypothetical protein